MSIKILTENYIDHNYDKNSNFLSSLANLDFVTISKTLKTKKIIPTLEHFFVFSYAFILNKMATHLFLGRSSKKLMRFYNCSCDYKFINFTDSPNLGYRSLSDIDFQKNFMVDDLNDVMKAFAQAGFKFTKEVAIFFKFFGISDSEIKHLYNFSNEDNEKINQIDNEKFINYVKLITKTNYKLEKKDIKQKNIKAFIKICETRPLNVILEFLNNNKKIEITEDCLRATLLNFNVGVFEYFHRFGYVPSLHDINMIFRLEQRFLLLLRFYPEQFYCNQQQNLDALKLINTHMTDIFKNNKSQKPVNKNHTKVSKQPIDESDLDESELDDIDQISIHANLVTGVSKKTQSIVSKIIQSDDELSDDDDDIEIKPKKVVNKKIKK